MSRQFSITPETAPHALRNNSITAQDMPKLAQVHTHVAEDAAKATTTEKSMTLMQGLKLYPKAVAWSVAISTCIIMEGFDLVLIYSLFGLPAFQNRFGDLQPDGTYQISAAWQAGLSNGAQVGEILGLLVVGWTAEKIGYRKTLIAALTSVIGFIFILFFAQNLPMLLSGLILCGLCWGAFQTLTTTYASEVCPVTLRPYLTTYVNLCWVIGQFLSSGVLKSVASDTSSFGYRLPYALQWIWPVPLITVLFLAPESPWWLVRKGRNEEAKHSLLRLTSKNQPDFNADETIAMMVYTNEFEKANTAGAGYLDCFKGVDLRRTEIVCGVWTVQTLCGASLIGYSTYFFEQAGLKVEDSFSLSLGLYALGAVGTISSWFLMGWFGRRTLYLWGQVIMVFILLIIGILGVFNTGAHGVQWGIGALLMIYNLFYDATVGPVCYALVAELPSTRLKNKTVVLARNAYNISGIIVNFLTPNMLNPTAWNWGAKAGFFWAGFCALCAIWTFFRLPEPKGRSYAELDMLFESKVSARKFSSTVVESFAAAGSQESLVDEKNMSSVKVESI